MISYSLASGESIRETLEIIIAAIEKIIAATGKTIAAIGKIIAAIDDHFCSDGKIIVVLGIVPPRGYCSVPLGLLECSLGVTRVTPGGTKTVGATGKTIGATGKTIGATGKTVGATGKTIIMEQEKHQQGRFSPTLNPPITVLQVRLAVPLFAFTVPRTDRHTDI